MFFGVFFLIFIFVFEIFVDTTVELAFLDPDEVLAAQVEEQLGTLLVGHYLLDCEDWDQLDFFKDAD